MLGRRRTAATVEDDRDVVVEHGPSLAKGPALVAGSILVAFGLAGLLKNNDFPAFSASFPDGAPQGTSFLGFEVNGWTNFFTITAGALLLFGAAQHHLAKMMSLLVGLALAACAVIATIDGGDVLGLAAANFWTKVGWAIAAVVLLVNSLMPRRRRERVVETPAAVAGVGPADRTVAEEPVGRRRRFGRPVADDRPVAERAPADEPATTTAPAAAPGERSATGDERTRVVERDPAR
jgi:hypothetical protein